MRTTMNTHIRLLAFFTGALVFGMTEGEAAAQSESPEYMPSDVLLLLDTSGSMSYTTVREPGDPGRYGLPRCGSYEATDHTRVAPVSFDSDATFTTSVKPADRWMILVNAFTGTIKGPACTAQNRATSAFAEEFGPSGAAVVYDRDYHLPFNRIVATGDDGEYCTPSPHPTARAEYFSGTTNALAWPGGDNEAVYWRNLTASHNPGVACGIPEPQAKDGIIDRLETTVRFGLMTFDPHPHRPNMAIGTGVPGAPFDMTAEYLSGSQDTWSYYPGWLGGGGDGPTNGWPAGCLKPGDPLRLFEVGARNPAAPPWEGRMIGFGSPTATHDEMVAHNDRVQQAILGMRPYGGTPLAGMLADALHFLTEDDTGTGVPNPLFYGGAVDEFVHSANRSERGCRKRIAILVTDGGPNLDLQPHCHPTSTDSPPGDGRCPYLKPQEYAERLYDHNIDLFVVGFSVTAGIGGRPMTCTQLMDKDDPDHRDCEELESCTSTCASKECAYGYCMERPEDELLAVCCNIEAIANAGSRYTAGDGPGLIGQKRHAYWAESGAALVATVSNLLRFPPSSLTRSQPVFAIGNANASVGANTIAGSRFFSSFEPVSDDLYIGSLVRERYECSIDPDDSSAGPVAKEVDTDVERGDYFGINLNGESPGFENRSARTIYSVVAQPDALTSVIHSDRSVRPYIAATNDDGIGVTGGSTATAEAGLFASSVVPGALFGAKTCTAPDPPCCTPYPTIPNPTAQQCRSRFLNLQLGFRDPTDGESEYSRTSALGAMINSTPEIVMAPNGHLRDESYQLFQARFRDRTPVMYAATADGQIHAFAIDRLNKGLNELWSFMPPAVLPMIPDQFPTRYAAVNTTIISGPLVAAEVSGDPTADVVSGRFLTRTGKDPENPDQSRWYTVLVGSFGSSGGYFALDVTNPSLTSDKTAVGYGSGPRFLWQLTKDSSGNPLFGARSTRPAVATLYFIMPGGTGTPTPAQHAVAILPGGYGGVRDPVARETTVYTTGTRVRADVPNREQTALYTPVSSNIHDQLTLAGARSLTIVRLDTGEIVRTFRRSNTYNASDPEAPEGLYTARDNKVTQAPFAAPIVGSIVAYPNTPGSVADRAYVGDAEGRLWRVDLSSANPADWSVALFHDAYPASGVGSVDDLKNSDVEPIETPPILSTDPQGRVTIAVSTGEQTSLGEKGKHSVWSLSEWREEGELVAHLNWFLDGSNAANASGSGEPHFVRGKGERVTGPMALFSSILYFTTYDPSARDTRSCSPGNSYLWGVHYLQAGTSQYDISSDPAVGPMPQFREVLATNPVRAVAMPGGVAFGVGVQQKPSCVDTTEIPDSLFGGAHRSVTSLSPGAFQLVVQLGGTGMAGSAKIGIDTMTFDLPPPRARSLIDSWAAILD